MTNSRAQPPRYHEDAALFREAVRFTAAQTGFPAGLIEKDYFCTLMLEHISSSTTAVVFKGGTCLAKVHAGFYRLSEDLDFAVSVPIGAGRALRRQQADVFRRALRNLPAAFRLSVPFRGSNNSTQYIGAVEYVSIVGGSEEQIAIEVSLREPLLVAPKTGMARTLLLDPVSGKPGVPEVPVACMAGMEAFAEKFRAALSRREVAIRDFFDIDYAVRKLELAPGDRDLLELIRRKLQIPGNDPIDLGPERLIELRAQLETRLKPVLRPDDFGAFDLDRAFALVRQVAQALA